MKKSSFGLVALGIAILTAGHADAVTAVTVRKTGGVVGTGYDVKPHGSLGVGRYAGAATHRGWVRTFSVGGDPGVAQEARYHVENSVRPAPGGISRGTAWLYERFARGSLDGFHYNSRKDARDLQEAVRQLEGAALATPGGNRFVDQAIAHFGGFEEAQAPYAGSDVRLLQLTPSGESPLIRGKAIAGKEVVFKEVAGPAPFGVLILGGGDQAIPVAYGYETDGAAEADRDRAESSDAGASGAPRNVPEPGGTLLLLALGTLALVLLRRRLTPGAPQQPTA